MEVVKSYIIGGCIMMMLAILPIECRGGGVPDSVTLDSLEQLYGGVSFNHAGHINLVKDCGICHHHTTGTLVDDANCVRCHQNSGATKVVSCKGCHLKEPFSVEALKARSENAKLYHQDKPGLKGAYHQGCMGCHTKMGGPTDCFSCHQRKREGNAFYNSGEFAPKKTTGTGNHH